MFLIIQTGDPVPLAMQQFGSFAQWFISGLKIHESHAHIVDVHRHQPLPDINLAKDLYHGVIITGSPAMVTDQDPWMRQTQSWLTELMAHQLPMFGVCYGHQLLVDLLGGKVTNNPKGRHMGLSTFDNHPTAADDPLFEPLPKQFETFVSHLQSVIRLPQSATLLGSCHMDDHHAFKAEQGIWGVQFHPEWNPQIMRAYIEARRDALINEGFDPEQMLAKLKSCETAHGLLGRFAQWASLQKSAEGSVQTSAL